MRDPMRLWSPFAMRSSGGSPPPAFDPASLFSGSDLGFVLDLARDTLSTTTPGVDVSSITTFVRSVEFYRGGIGKTPKYQLDGSLPYLQFDGVDDWMTTSDGLSLTGSGRTIITASRKTSDVSIGAVIESSPSWTDASGKFAHYSPGPTASSYGVGHRTTTVQSAVNAPAPNNAPHTAVMTSVFVAGSHVLRINGAQIASATPTGSMSDHTASVTIGAQNGTSRFFNGRLYAMIVIDRVLTAGELAGAEAWAASKCGITL